MTSLDPLSLEDITENSCTTMENSDFKAHLASILTCSYELQDLLTSCSPREDAVTKAETLGEAIRAVTWTTAPLNQLLTAHKQDVPHVLEAIQIVGRLSPAIR
jgi:hypothetical protein